MSSKKPKTKKPARTQTVAVPKDLDIRMHAMLISLTISGWSGVVRDQQAATDLEVKHQAENDTFKASKRLIPKGALDEQRKLYREARACVNQWSLPWSNDGQRIILNSAYEKYTEAMRDIKARWDVAVREFADAYPSYLASAPKRLGSAFKAADYPDPKTIASRFNLATHIVPIPAAADFRVELSAAHTARIRQQIEEDVKKALTVAVQDVWRRMKEVVEKMATKLKESDSVFRDSLVGNIEEIVELIPALNITQDANIAKVAARMKNELTKHGAQTLREDETVRKTVAKQAQDILDKMGDFV